MMLIKKIIVYIKQGGGINLGLWLCHNPKLTGVDEQPFPLIRAHYKYVAP